MNCNYYRKVLLVLVAGFFFLNSGLAISATGLDSRPLNGSCVAPERLQTQGAIELQPVASVTWPVDMVQAPDNPDKWYVVDRGGLIFTYQRVGATFTQTGTFMDISDRVQRMFNGKQQNEMGLLGMVFHPDFSVNGEFFLYYSSDSSTPNGTEPIAAKLSRFKSFDNGVTGAAGSEETILSYNRTKDFHWGGRPTFGPSDGYLYIALGDAAQNGKAQNLNSQWGKMLRIDVDGGTPYAIPADNPYVGIAGLDEIYAYGFRNPWRWSFDSLTGEIWLGDVGNSLWEEVNKVVKGGNYGWRTMEGEECSFFDLNCDTTGKILPVTVYGHDANAGPIGNAIIGGYVYRGSLMPSLYGKYIYADVGGTIWAYDEATDQNTLLLDSGNFNLSIAESFDDRELYLLANENIFRFTEAGGSTGPGNFPELLSETGCFDSNDPTQPGPMLIPYDVNIPLWSDNAAKDRWMMVPDNSTIDVEADGDFTYPIGSVLFKNFKLNNQIIETRMFTRHDDGGWGGYTYEWNDAQTDAVLVAAEGKSKQVGSQIWEYPSRSDCMGCHTSASGRVLGPEIAQLNSSMTYPSTGFIGNQLETLEHIGMFSQPLSDMPQNLPALPDVTDISASLESRARGYLHSNCAMCHRPNGPGQGPEDFRWYLPLNQMGAVNEEPTQGNMGVAGAKLLFPGDPAKSILALRMHTLGNNRMPPLGTSIVDQVGTQLVDDWIQSMQVEDCGEPLVNASSEKGVYIWKDCFTDEWTILTTAGGDSSGVFYNGTITSDTAFTQITPVSLERSDSLDTSNPTIIDFTFKIWNSGRDGAKFTVPASAGVCLDVSSADTGNTVFVGPNKSLVTASYDLQGSGCGQTGQVDNVEVLRALYYPTDEKIWVRASSDLQPATTALLTVIATTNGVDEILGDLLWRPADAAYQRTFKNLPVAPDCITVISAAGGTGELPTEGTGSCDGIVDPPPGTDTLTLSRAIFYPAKNRVWIKANSDALPVGSANITATIVTNGVQTVLGTVGWKAPKNAYQQEFKNITVKPDTVILTSDLGGTVTGTVLSQ